MLTFPFTPDEALVLLGRHVPDCTLYGYDEDKKVKLSRFVALKDLDHTTGDAVTWRRDGTHISGSFGLLVSRLTFTGPKAIGAVIACPDPHRTFFTLMRMVYGDDYQPPMTRVLQGENVRIGTNCTIGSAGFGHVPEMGTPLKPGETRWRVPHIGRVVIEDDVDIGDNTTINRGCLGDTIIRRGAKIDSHVFVAHNAEIGENAVLVAGSIICGSAKIGAGAWIAAGACVRNGVTVGENAVVGLMANVVKDVPEGATVVGNPARVT